MTMVRNLIKFKVDTYKAEIIEWITNGYDYHASEEDLNTELDIIGFNDMDKR